MLNFHINVETTGQMNGKGDAYVPKSGGQEMFHARFDGSLVL